MAPESSTSFIHPIPKMLQIQLKGKTKVSENMCLCIVHLFSPLHLNYSAFHITHLHPNVLFPLSQARDAPRERATPASLSCTGASGHIRNINEKPTGLITSRGVTLPRPTERLMHLQKLDA